MKRFLYSFSFCLALFLCLEQTSHGQGVLQYNTPVSVTDTNTTVSFGFAATNVVFKNDGANEVYLSFTATAATTASFELKAGESLAFSVERSEVGLGRFDVICAAAETATLRVLALKLP